MTTSPSAAVRLSPELQAEYQQIYNDPAKQRSDEWLVAAKALTAAGIITADPDDPNDLEQSLRTADSRTDGQSL